MTDTPDNVPTPSADAAEPVENAPDPAPESPATSAPPVYPEGWTDLDTRAVDLVRTLAMDAVQKVGNGHPGTAMSLAPLAYTLFQRRMRHDPADPAWLGRDRFVLSAGHSSLTLYIQLYLAGYGLELDDLKALRTWGSLTPGHPEHGHTAGVETTTGPLGQGVGNAVGMAMAARRERGLLDPDAAPGESVFDHRVFAIASDGDMEEGVSGEASSLAGHQQLGNLTLIYDDNKISIEDDTNIALSEDVAARYAAYGWHVQDVEWRRPDGTYVEDVRALEAALDAADAETSRPSFIRLRTIIAWPAPNAQNTGKSHGSALGAEEVAATKKVLGLDPDKTFDVPAEVLEHARRVRERGAAAHAGWTERFEAWSQADPERRELLDRLVSRTLPAGWTEALPSFPADPKGMATRKASGEVLTAIVPRLPELWGGSADLAESNNTTPKGEPSFIPSEHQTKEFPGGPYGRTFLVFSDYMRPAVRLAAVMKIPVTYVWTHDSIGLGEDGPTHQPVEHLAALRAIPGLDVVRPADANETAVAWRTVLEHTDRPAGLCLTRQNVPTWDRSADSADGTTGSAEGTARGAYVLAEAAARPTPDVILVATGSEVWLAVEARKRLEEEGVATRVVSMPCREWFAEQDQAYQQEVFPTGVKARVSVEAAVAQGWREIVGDAGECVSLEHFGASAAYTTLYEQFGFTPDRVVAAAHASLERVGVITGSTTGN